MQGGPRLMRLTLSEFLDVVWAFIVTPPPMADAHEWRETMFCWFYLGREPVYIMSTDPKSRRQTKRIAPREAQVTAAGVAKPERAAKGADEAMKRLRDVHAANAERRRERREKVAAERALRDQAATDG
jgi:hypothetical protein